MAGKGEPYQTLDRIERQIKLLKRCGFNPREMLLYLLKQPDGAPPVYFLGLRREFVYRR